MTVDERARIRIKQTVILAVAISFTIIALMFEILAFVKNSKFKDLMKKRYFSTEKVIEIFSNNQVVLHMRDKENNVYRLRASRKDIYIGEDLRIDDINRLYSVYKNDIYVGIGNVNAEGELVFLDVTIPKVKLIFKLTSDVEVKKGILKEVGTGRVIKSGVRYSSAGTVIWSSSEEVARYNKKRLLLALDFFTSDIIVHSSPFIMSFYIKSENKRKDSLVLSNKLNQIQNYSYTYKISDVLDLSDYENGIGQYRYKLLVTNKKDALNKKEDVYNIKIKFHRTGLRGFNELVLDELVIQEYMLLENMQNLEKTVRRYIADYFGKSLQEISKGMTKEMVKGTSDEMMREVTKMFGSCASTITQKPIYNAISDTEFKASVYYTNEMGEEKKVEMIFELKSEEYKLKGVKIL